MRGRKKRLETKGRTANSRSKAFSRLATVSRTPTHPDFYSTFTWFAIQVPAVGPSFPFLSDWSPTAVRQIARNLPRDSLTPHLEIDPGHWLALLSRFIRFHYDVESVRNSY